MKVWLAIAVGIALLPFIVFELAKFAGYGYAKGKDLYFRKMRNYDNGKK